MRKLMLFIAALGTGFTLQAQPSYQEAKALLQSASEKMRSYESLKIEFSYRFENSRVEPPIVQEQKGSIILRGNDYRLKLDNLEQLRLGDKLYNILPADEEVQITTYDPEEEDQGLTPNKILSLFQKGYSYKLGGTEVIGGKTIRYVILKPKASEEIDKIMIGIEAKSKHVYSMKQWGTNGTITLLQVLVLTPNPSLPPGFFRFREADYPGYYIAR